MFSVLLLVDKYVCPVQLEIGNRQSENNFENKEKIITSKLFAEIDIADRRFLHKKLQPEELRDYLLSNTKTEHIDIFSKQYHYTASDKNFTVKNLKEIAERKTPSELEFLAHLWLGANGPLTDQQIKDLQTEISNFPPAQLKELRTPANFKN